MNKKKVSLLMMMLTLMIATVTAQQQSTGSIKGTIITADNKPAEGVTILIKNSDKNAIANNKGAFEIKNLTAGNYTILVSLIGYKNAEADVNVVNSKATTIAMQLTLSSKDLNEVVITTQSRSFKTNRVSSTLRLQSPILETPQNIQVVTDKLIKDQQIFDMVEGITRNVSGATKEEHWDNYARLTMRGSNIAAFRNGMNVSSAYGPLTEDLSMVERVEFVKGPAGFMLSNGDPSGFYNVVTKKPTGVTKGEVDLSLGTFNLYRGTLDLDGKLTKDGKLLYRLDIMGQSKGTQRAFDYNNRYTFAPVLKYLVDDNTSVTLEYTQQYSQVNVLGSNYIFSKRGYTNLPKTATIAEANLAPTTMNDRSILAILEHKINNNWKYTAQMAYFNYQQQGSDLWINGFSATNDSLIQRNNTIWDVLGTSKIGQMFLTGDVKTGSVTHKILGGLDMSSKEYYNDWNQTVNLGGLFNIYTPVYGTAAAPVFDRSKNIKERGVRYFNGYTGFYAQDELGFFNNQLRLTLGARYTTLKTSDPYSGDFSHNKFTPRIGLSYSVDKNTSLYFLNDQSFVENYGTDWQGKSFNPVTGNNVEAGIKRDWLDGKWNSGVSVYQISRNNVLTADQAHPNPAGGYYSRESGQQQTKGVEVDVHGQIFPGLDAVINYAYTNAKTTKDNDPKIVGNQVGGSAKNIQNTWLNYRVDKGTLAGFGISFGYQYQGGRTAWYVFDNSVQKLPDYFRMDGSLSYRKGKIGFNLVVNDILNKYLYSGSPYAGYFNWQAEAGTNARCSVAYRF